MVQSKDIRKKASDSFEETLDNISEEYEDQQCTMEELEQIVKSMLNTLPKLDRDKLRKEMEDMQVETHKNPTTFDINEGMSLTQGYKDRLTEIYNVASREYKLRKRTTEMLVSANMVISRGKSKDKREGEAVMKYPVHMLNLEASEIFLDEVNQILNNIKSVGDSISRQGSMLQMQLQIGEYRKISNGRRQQSTSEAEEIEGNDYKSGTKKLEWSEV